MEYNDLRSFFLNWVQGLDIYEYTSEDDEELVLTIKKSLHTFIDSEFGNIRTCTDFIDKYLEKRIATKQAELLAEIFCNAHIELSKKSGEDSIEVRFGPFRTDIPANRVKLILDDKEGEGVDVDDMDDYLLYSIYKKLDNMDKNSIDTLLP